MNWAKGRATKGRGTSFQGALRYVLHDKRAETSERVGFIELRNLGAEDPHLAWREMMTLCEAADELKQRSGVKATGNKLKKPVYAFTLNWHEDDRPDPEHMRRTADSALLALGMDHLQSVIVEHTDTAHRHVHVIVNLVDPETGKSASLSNDGHKLDRWADRYEVAQGVIRSPARRAKFEALDRGQTPPKRPEQAASREEWEATRGLKGAEAKDTVRAIKAALAARVAAIKEKHAMAFQGRRNEGDRLWKGYKADRQAIRDRYQPFIDAIYKSRRKTAPHPYTEQALRDLQETAEWREFGRGQFQQRKAFNIREGHALGVISNAIRLHYANLRRGGIAALFMLAVSSGRRRRLFEQRQQVQKQYLRETQAQRRKGHADTLRAACRHELARRANEFASQRKATVGRHAGEIAAQKAEWRQVAIERDKVWAEYRREFDATVESPEADRSPSLRQDFNGASPGKPDPVDSRKGDDEGRSDSGSDGSLAPKVSTEEKRGWRARRKAADRQADGSYKPRSRGGKGPERTRSPRR